MCFCELLNFAYKLSFSRFDPYKLMSLCFYVIEFGILQQILYYTGVYVFERDGDGDKIKVPRLREEVGIGFLEIA